LDLIDRNSKYWPTSRSRTWSNRTLIRRTGSESIILRHMRGESCTSWRSLTSLRRLRRISSGKRSGRNRDRSRSSFSWKWKRRPSLRDSVSPRSSGSSARTNMRRPGASTSPSMRPPGCYTGDIEVVIKVGSRRIIRARRIYSYHDLYSFCLIYALIGFVLEYTS